jgi:hypothetical protein
VSFSNEISFCLIDLISDGELVFPEVLKVFMAIMLTASALGQALAFAPNVAKAKAAASTIFEIIDHQPDFSATTGSVPGNRINSIEILSNKDIFQIP